MKASTKKQLRCAVYTRKSTDHNLELEFNSLDAQREACEAYIKSQSHEGWRLIPTKYDDGGHSGASLERPALQKLLDDVRAGKIDVIVVYKIDRLTRSLTDFAKLVEVFDQQSVSFVSITQSFNTTTSMGRLTLNVLLSFAQFEREVIGERVRDKISASKKKGIWVGGPVPLGYRAIDKKLQVVPSDAATVRMIFERYLALKSISALQEELDRKNIRTKKKLLSTGRLQGGCRFGKGMLRYLLRNRIYIGEIAYRGAVYQGEQKPIIDRATFDAAQKLLTDNAVERKAKHQNSNALLTGLLFDDRGNRMTPTYSRKRGARYRYYISHALLQSRKHEAGSVTRVPAHEVEEAVLDALRRNGLLAEEEAAPVRQSLEALVNRIEVNETGLSLTLIDRQDSDTSPKGFDDKVVPLSIPWTKRPTVAKKGVLDAPSIPNEQMSRETRDAFLTAIARARKWLADIESGAATSLAEIAKREGKVERYIRLLLPLAFTPPPLVRSIADGALGSSSGVAEFARAIPVNWNDQKARNSL